MLKISNISHPPIKSTPKQNNPSFGMKITLSQKAAQDLLKMVGRRDEFKTCGNGKTIATELFSAIKKHNLFFNQLFQEKNIVITEMKHERAKLIREGSNLRELSDDVVHFEYIDPMIPNQTFKKQLSTDDVRNNPKACSEFVQELEQGVLYSVSKEKMEAELAKNLGDITTISNETNA